MPSIRGHLCSFKEGITDQPFRTALVHQCFSQLIICAAYKKNQHGVGPPQSKIGRQKSLQAKTFCSAEENNVEMLEIKVENKAEWRVTILLREKIARFN